MERNISDVLGVVGEAVREIDVSTPDHPEEAKKRTVVIGRVEWDVLVLTDGDFRQPVGGGVHGLTSDKADQRVPLGVADDLRIVRSAEPDARRRLDTIAPVVSGNEQRPDEW